MSKMILFSGQSLQRNYQKCGGNVKSEKERLQDKKDKEAIRKSRKQASWKTKVREQRMDNRDNNKESLDKKIQRNIDSIPNETNKKISAIKENAERTVKGRIEEAKKQTNKIAREHNLPEPNNPEAMAHDRLHCYACDGHLHIPDAYKSLDSDIAKLFDDKTVKHLCCFCFSKMSDDELSIFKGEASAEIRLAVYNPEESVNKNVDINGKIKEIRRMSDLDKIRLKSRMKKYQHIVNMVGNIKHDYLQEGDDFENIVRNQARTRYTACTL